MVPPKLTITNLSKIYRGGTQALRDVNLSIPPGMFGLLGPNGAGKTSLMRVLAGLISPSSGDAVIDKHSVNSQSGRQHIREMLGYLPQEVSVHPYLTAREFLTYVATLKGFSNADVRKRMVNDILEMVHLTDVSHQRIRTFSGGMKRRVGIGQALIGNPELLIIDEPTVGLDPEERLNIRNILVQFAKTCTILLSTHIIEDISQTCRELAILDKGQVLFQGNVASLISQLAGRVYVLTSKDNMVPQGIEIISMTQVPDGTQYRVVGYHLDASAVEPTLEDAYIYMMRSGRKI